MGTSIFLSDMANILANWCIYIWWHASFFKISDKTLGNSEMVMAIFVPILHFAVANLSCNTLSSLFYFWYKPGLVNVFIFTLSQHGKYTCTHEQSSSKSGSTHTSHFLRSPGHHMNLGVKTLQHLCPGIVKNIYIKNFFKKFKKSF